MLDKVKGLQRSNLFRYVSTTSQRIVIITKEILMNDGSKMTAEKKAAYEAETDEEKKMQMLRVRTPGYHDDTEDEEAAQEAIQAAKEAAKARGDADAAPTIESTA